MILLATGPSVSGFAGRQATLAYVLATLLFVLTICTRFPLGVFKVVNLATHGAIELMLGFLLLLLPWMANFSRGILSRNFYVAVGFLMIALWLLTDFRGVRERTTMPPA